MEHHEGEAPHGHKPPARRIMRATVARLEAAPSHARDCCCYGLDWSGGRRAGDKVWRATLDPVTKHVLALERPWEGQEPAKVIRGVAAWLAELGEGWVGMDFPFGIRRQERELLLGETEHHPRAWGAALRARYPTFDEFYDAVLHRKLLGKGQRATDAGTGAPFAPLLIQIIYQTYWGMALLAELPEDHVHMLPWDYPLAHSGVQVLETCPAIVLKGFGLSNRGYKRLPGSKEVRAALLQKVKRHSGWHWSKTVSELIIADREGDALDAILAGIGAYHASCEDLSAIIRVPHALTEGFIFA